jgi:hypothetical protein
MTKREWAKMDRLSKKIKAINYLGGECEKCGETNIFLLEFHHKSKTEKETTIWAIQDYRWSIIEKEIKKCILLCGNCHGKLHHDNTTNTYKTNKKIFLEYKGINGCEKCGYDKCNSSLDLHHKNMEEKDFTFGEITTSYKNLQDLTEKIEKELNKCTVLCKNCHKLEHADIDFFEKNQDQIINKSKNLREIRKKINREEVKKLYENGMMQIDIAKHFNATKGAISSIIKELGIKK